MTDPRHALYWIAATLIALAMISVCAGLQEWWIWRRGIVPPRPKWKPGDYPRFPPGYGTPSWKDWQRIKIARFRSPIFKRLRRWWKGER